MKICNFFLHIITLTVRTFDFWFSFKFFKREENGKLMVTVFTSIFISRHIDPLIVRLFAVVISTIISILDSVCFRKKQ
jgi:hypothetical protein